MKLHFERFSAFLLFLALALSSWGQKVVLHETFDNFKGEGGNPTEKHPEGQWSGSMKSPKITSGHLSGWQHVGEIYQAHQCAKVGKAAQSASLTTPALTGLSGKAVLTFRAGSWDNKKYSHDIKISIVDGGTLTPAQVTLEAGKFNTYTFTIEGATATSKIRIEGAAPKNNMFFLDDVKVVASEEGGQVNPPTPPTPPQPQPKPTEIRTLDQLKGLADGTAVVLLMGRDNPAYVNALVGKTECYVADTTAALLLRNFLPTDAGWHPTMRGALMGRIEATYATEAGLPTLRPTAKSTGETVLCIDQFGERKALPATIENLADFPAQKVLLTDVTLGRQEARYYAEQGGKRIYLSSQIEAWKSLLEGDLTTRRFTLQAVVGVAKGAPQLLPLALDEVMTQLVLKEDQDPTADIAAHADQIVDVDLHLTLQPEQWRTLCLPFAMDDPEEAFGTELSILAFDGCTLDNHKVRFRATDKIEAGVPYLVKAAGETSGAQVDGVKLISTPKTLSEAGIDFVGAFAPWTMTDKCLRFDAQQHLCAPEDQTQLPAFSAHLRVADADLREKLLNGGITALERLPHADAVAPLRTLTGQRVVRTAALPAGVYLQGGRKIVVP